MDTDPCEICGLDAEIVPSVGDYTHQNCPRCGKFKLARTAGTLLRQGVGQEVRTKLSGWVRDQNRSGTVPIITSDISKRIASRPLPSVAERAERLLLEAARDQKRLGSNVTINDPRFVASTYSQDQGEVSFLLKLLSEQNLMQSFSLDRNWEITPSGYMAIDELTRNPSQSEKGFVAMWFDTGLEPVYENGFQVGVLNAGYEPVRIDRIEHVNRIDDEIIAHIKAAKFVVADFTGHRGGVYFEAGFALGLDIPVIWSCRKDHLDDLHFDIRQYNCIDWETPEELALRLQRRIEATLGKGPKTVLSDG